MSRSGEGFLARWSRRKIAARADRPALPREPQADAAATAAPGDMPLADAPHDMPHHANEASPSPVAAAQSASPELPALESLTPDSDFAPFMRAGVDPAVKGEALKTLFSDPALYPMDGLDVYIDDYTKPDPLPPGWLEKLNQLATLHGEPAPASEPATASETATDRAAEVETAKNVPAAEQPGTVADAGSSNSDAPPHDRAAAGETDA